MLNEALEKKKQFLKDVQSEQDSRNIPLKHVGISDLRWPLVLRDRQKGEQHTVATVSVAVDLPKDLRGTHMSRFVQCLQKLDIVNLSALEEVLDDLKESLLHGFELCVYDGKRNPFYPKGRSAGAYSDIVSLFQGNQRLWSS